MEWIKVEDELPEKLSNVLVYGMDGMPYTAWAFYSSESRFVGRNEFYDNVTHWMPLPEPPPKEETK